MGTTVPVPIPEQGEEIRRGGRRGGGGRAEREKKVRRFVQERQTSPQDGGESPGLQRSQQGLESVSAERSESHSSPRTSHLKDVKQANGAYTSAGRTGGGEGPLQFLDRTYPGHTPDARDLGPCRSITLCILRQSHWNHCTSKRHITSSQTEMLAKGQSFFISD